MERIKVPSGSSITLENVFNNLQDKIEKNITNRISSISQSFGSIVDTYNDNSISNDLKVELNTIQYPNAIIINAGMGIFPNGEFIKKELSTVDLETEANSYYFIKLKYKNVGTLPVPTMNAFNFSKSTVPNDGTVLKNTYYYDSFEVVYTKIQSFSDINNFSINEIPLAIVKTDSSGNLLSSSWTLDSIKSADGVIDLRPLFCFKLSKKVLSDKLLVFKDRDSVGENKIAGSLEAEQFNINNIKLINSDSTLLDENDGTYVYLKQSTNIYNTVSGLIETIDPIQNKIIFNSEVEFTNNVVLSNITISNKIANFRIGQIAGSKTFYTTDVITSGLLSADGALGKSNDHLNVLLKWNWDDIVGYGNSNSTFTITNKNWQFAENELAGMYLWIPSVYNLYIVSHPAKSLNQDLVLTVCNLDNTLWDGSGVVINENNPAWIHSNADSYVITAIPMDNHTPRIYSSKQFVVNNIEGPTLCQTIVSLRTMGRYRFKIFGQTYLKKTNVLNMIYTGFAGGFLNETVAPDSDNAYLIKHPYIFSANAGVSAETTLNGFQIVIKGWDDAEEFEIIYNTIDEESLKFPVLGGSDNTQSTLIVPSTSRILDITTSSSRQYHIKVRPRIGGQQVAEPKYCKVYSGSKGLGPQDVPIVKISVNHSTYTGTLCATPESLGNKLWRMQLADSGHFITNPVTERKSMIDKNVEGMILVVNNYEFVIQELEYVPGSSDVTVIAQSLQDSTPSLSSGDTYKIGFGSKKARCIYSSSISCDYEVTYIDIDTDVLIQGSSINDQTYLRLYQESDELSADYVIVPATNYGVQSPGDYNIKWKNGSIILDLYNTSENAVNNSTFIGNIIVYGRAVNNNPKNKSDLV